MLNNQRFFKFVCIFGDAKEHQYNEILWLGLGSVDKNRKEIDIALRKTLNNNLVSKTSYGATERCSYILTDKGDQYLRETAIKYGGNIRWYKYMDRTPESAQKYGR